MAAEALKSTQVTNLDSLPPVANTAGESGVGSLRCLTQSVSPTNGASIGSTYRVLRLPSNAKVKHVLADTANTAGLGSYNVGLAYSDAPLVTSPDGTPPAVAGSVVNATLFASAWSASAVAEATDITQQSGTITGAGQNQPLWQAAGLTADPGGFMDVLLTSTVAPTAAGTINLEAQFVV